MLNDTTLNIDSEDVYVGAFRQEAKKVWYRPASFERNYFYEDPEGETLLYDFSKNVGDTIWHNLLYVRDCYMGENITASIVHSVTIQNDKLIYNTFQYVNNGLDGYGFIDLYPTAQYDSWVEGIGGLNNGLFWFLYYPPMSGGSFYKLACFKQGNEVKYVNNTCNMCFCSGSSADISEKSSLLLEIIQISDHIRIKGESSIFPCRLSLFAPMGQLILEKLFQSDKDEALINQKGIWLYQIQKENRIIKTGKIIIK